MVFLTVSAPMWRRLLGILAESRTVVTSSKETAPVVFVQIFNKGVLELEFDALIEDSHETSELD